MRSLRRVIMNQRWFVCLTCLLKYCKCYLFTKLSNLSVSDASGAKEHKVILSCSQRPPEQLCRRSARFCKFCKLQAEFGSTWNNSAANPGLLCHFSAPLPGSMWNIYLTLRSFLISSMMCMRSRIHCYDCNEPCADCMWSFVSGHLLAEPVSVSFKGICFDPILSKLTV